MVIEIKFDKNTYYLRQIEFTNLPLEEKLKVLYDLLYFIFENEGAEENEIIEKFSTEVGGFYGTTRRLIRILWFEGFILPRRKRVNKKIKILGFPKEEIVKKEREKIFSEVLLGFMIYYLMTIKEIANQLKNESEN